MNSALHKSKLASKSAYFIALIVIMSSLIGSLVVASQNIRTQVIEIQENTDRMIGAIAPILEYSVWVVESESIAILADSIQSLSFVKHVEILDDTGIVSVTAGKKYNTDCRFCVLNIIDSILPVEKKIVLLDIKSRTQKIGELNLMIDYSDVLQNLASLALFFSLFILVQSYLIFYVIFNYVGKNLISPLNLISTLSRKIGLRQPLSRTELNQLDLYSHHNDEVGAAVRNLSVMNTLIQAYSQDLETAIKKRTSELELAKNQAQAAASAKSDFVANISHEIRTPLGAIANLTELMGRTEMSEKQTDYVSNIATSSDILMKIVNDVLDFSKVSQADFRVEKKPFNLHESLDNVISQFRHIAQDKGIAFEVFRQFPCNVRCLSDQFRLEQVLLNLIGNSFKFTSSGKVSVRVTCPTNNPDHVTFFVSDTGIGIAEEKLESIFNVFEQADTAITKQYGGTGLGLAISKKLIENMGGRVKIRSASGKGTTICFSLPLAVLQPDEKIDHETERPMTAVLTEDMRLYKRVSAFCRSANLSQPTLYRSNHAFSEKGQRKKTMHVFRDPRLGISAKRIPEKYVERVEYFRTRGALPGTGDDAPAVSVLDVPLKWQDFRNRVLNVMQGGGATDKSSRKTDRPLQDMRLLVAEDNHINRFTIRELLSDAGAVCTIVENGKLAVEMLQSTAFDVVLMDIQMPVMDGITATRLLREDSRFETFPIIALTAATSGLSEIKQEDGDFTACLVKPLNMNDLVQVIRNIQKKDTTLKPVAVSSPEKGDEQVFDPEICLRAANNNRALSEKVFCEFLSHYGKISDPADIADPVKNDLYEFRQYYHTLRGLSGMVGAIRLQEMAAALEDEIVENKKLPDHAAMQACRDTLGICRDAIADYLKNCQRDATPETLQSDEVETTELLLDLLSVVQAGQANAYDMSLKLPPHWQPGQRIQSHLREFDFDRAEGLIKAELSDQDIG